MSAARRRRPVRRRTRRGRKSGFWYGFRHATHTDHLRTRIGGAVGRGVIRMINNNRRATGKPLAPQRGGSWTVLPHEVRRPRVAGVPRQRAGASTKRGGAPMRPPAPGTTVRRGQATVTKPGPAPRPAPKPKRQPPSIIAPATQTKAQAAGAPPAFSGPHVTASNGRAANRKVPFGTTSVTSSGVAGPGNRGAGAGVGVPAYGTGGAGGDGDHMISPGSAGGSATGGAPVGPNGLYNARGAERSTANSGHPPATSPGGPEYGHFRKGGRPVTKGPLNVGTIETPQTDAEYVAMLTGIAEAAHKLADMIMEAQAGLLAEVEFNPAALRAFDFMAEHCTGLGNAAVDAIHDFRNTYGSALALAQEMGGLPAGKGGPFFTGEVNP